MKTKKKPNQMMSWYEADESSELRETCWLIPADNLVQHITQEHLLYKQPIFSARNKCSFQTIHWAAKRLEIKVKLNTFSCFFCQESHHHDLNIFIPFFFALPLLRFILEHIWIIRRKKGENYINSTYFQEIPQNLMVLASYYSISHMKLYTLDLPKINPRSSTVD